MFPNRGLAHLVAAIVFVVAGAATSQLNAQPAPLRIAIAKTFLTEQPKGAAEIATDDFKTVLKKATDLDGAITSKLNATEIADKLAGSQLDFGIFHAHEFAWAQKKHPKLAPLMIAVDRFDVEHAYIIVHKNDKAKTLADLRGKKIDVPLGTKEHCRLLLRKRCADLGAKSPADFFSVIEKSSTKKIALDNVAQEKVAAALVDRLGLEFYKDVRGPVYEKNLRVLEQSGDFPPAVLAYLPGAIDAKVLDQFKTGLLKAHTIPEGKDMMKSWNIDEFRAAPSDYAKGLAELLKSYPPPMAK
ncbi:MAG TPA: PhnD/SsuA/transferrin family substrate-binding protein [Gemmataceae bacterium]|nr:PhnD/SsuA/transferrin family substrate-binding protein [Gemmataceae bacterium]